jgi:hypothetical protein
MTLNGHFRFTYIGGRTRRNDGRPDKLRRRLTRRPAAPLETLEAFRTVKLELLDGVKTFDGAPVKPWSVTFSVGAN